MKDNEIPLYTSPELGSKVTAYAKQHSTPLPKHITEYYAEMSTRKDSSYISSEYQSQFNIFLAKLTGTKRVLEIGVYVGFSALVWAHAVGPSGLVTGLEYVAEYAELSRKAFKANNVNNVEVIVGPAAETLPKLSPSEPYDLVFIDADKPSYPGYLKQLLQASQPGSAKRLLRPGALIVSDNVLRLGLVVDDKALGDVEVKGNVMAMAIALREFNVLCLNNPRLESVIIPLWDGVNVARLVD
ncbi:hypothetical protein FZEAL_10793 [Fusarium zealandicum]|uniref:O-methyltransferase n=1 Tax=Fusarium zealandicum TaxID=1053134 RepID=A0A8H4TW90_9HYPO|nr:hypothetical protein FZEAL_10793 [Fusarium zealandicum]